MRFLEFLNITETVEFGFHGWIEDSGELTKGEVHGEESYKAFKEEVDAIMKKRGIDPNAPDFNDYDSLDIISNDLAIDNGWIRFTNVETEFNVEFKKPSKKALASLSRIVRDLPEPSRGYYINNGGIARKREALRYVNQLFHITEAITSEYGAWIDTVIGKVYRTDFEGHEDFIINNHELFGISFEALQEYSYSGDLYRLAFDKSWLRVIFPSEDEDEMYVQGRNQDIKKAWPLIRPYTKMRTGEVLLDFHPKGSLAFTLPQDRGKMIRFFTGTVNEEMQNGVDIDFQYDVTGHHHGQDDGNVIAYNPQTRNIYGYIDWTSFQNETHIRMIEVKPEFRRHGIARMMIDFLKKKNEEPINWGMTTPEGTEFRKAIGDDDETR